MTEQNVILVTGATGNVGRNVVSQLLGAGANVRALTRDPGSAGLPDGTGVVCGDLTAPETLEAGMDGVDAVFLVWPFSTLDAASPVLDVISRYARRIVYLSTMGVSDEAARQASQITAFHAGIERLIARSGLEWVFLRAGGFATNTLAWAPQIRAESVVRAPFGAMARPLIHERDIAAVAARTLTTDGPAGAKYVLTGPERLTQVEQVRIIGEVIGRPLRFEEISRETAREQMLGAWGDPSVVDGVLDVWAGFVTDPEPITPTVQEVTGAPARTYREWAIDHAGDFR